MTDCSSLRVAFAGTPDFARTALSELLASPHSVVGVLTQPDRPSGRGRKLSPSAVKTLALGNITARGGSVVAAIGLLKHSWLFVASLAGSRSNTPCGDGWR